MPPTIIDDSWYQRPLGVPDRTSAGGVVLRRGGDRWLVALVREGDYHDFVLPKGGVEKGESLEEAARRETEEEAGLSRLKLLGPVGVRSRLTFSKKKWVTVHYFLFTTDERGTLPTDTRKHFHPAAWWPLDGLPPLLWPEQRELLETQRGAMLRMVEEKR
jgi:ADP-ribose pyrophosphatase YjhB (NUDIX family)